MKKNIMRGGGGYTDDIKDSGTDGWRWKNEGKEEGGGGEKEEAKERRKTHCYTGKSHRVPDEPHQK